MNAGLIIAITVSAGLLFVYAMLERKVNQTKCPQCGSRFSRENPEGHCPRCSNGEKPEIVVRPKGFWRRWPVVTLIALPLGIIIVDSAVVLKERSESDRDLAVRIVKESASQKENFTVQQYLYATFYHRRDAGEDVQIAGWGTQELSEDKKQMVVTFTFSEGGAARVAVWNVDLEKRKVVPVNDVARELSWD